MRELQIADRKNIYYLYSPNPAGIDLVDAMIRRSGPMLPDNVWMHTFLPGKIWKDGMDLLHVPDFIMPVFCPVPTVITVHDLAVFDHPEMMEWKFKTIQRLFLPVSLKKAAMIIVPSYYTSRRLKKLFNVPETNIRVIPLGVAPCFHPRSKIETTAIRKKYNLPDRYILYVGSFEPRKGIDTLIGAHDILIGAKEKLPLVLVGGDGPAVRRERLYLPYLSQEELASVYSAAVAFVFPSVYEGFGLPPLEAMACGTPVISSNAASLKELIADAAIEIKPGDPDVLADSILKVVRDADLMEDLKNRGLKRASRYNWKHTALETLKVYEEIKNCN